MRITMVGHSTLVIRGTGKTLITDPYFGTFGHVAYAYHRPFMAEIGRRFHIDVAMMPVATFRIPPTMGDRGAAAAVRDLRPKTVIPIHLGITPRSFLLRTAQGPLSFARKMREAGEDAKVVHLREGEHWDSGSGAATVP